MKNYGILRVEKIKLADGGGLRGRGMHNFREFGNSQKAFDPKKTALNEYEGATSYAELQELAKARWATLTGKPRSDAVGMLEVVVTTTAGAIPENKEKAFFEAVKKEVSGWYGAENVLSVAVHRDETTPHCHIFLTPIETVRERKKHLSAAEKCLTEEQQEKFLTRNVTKLNAQKLLGGKEKLSRLQTEFHAHVFRRFGLSRGEIFEKPTKNQRSNLSKRAEKLTEREKKVSEREKSLVEEVQSRIAKSGYSAELPKPKLLESAESYRQRILPEHEKTAAAAANNLRVAKKYKADKTQLERTLNTMQIDNEILREKNSEYLHELKAWRTLKPSELRQLADEKERQKAQNRAKNRGYDSWEM